MRTIRWASSITTDARSLGLAYVRSSDTLFVANGGDGSVRGNITGLTNISVELNAKLVELFVELVPGMKRVGLVHNPNNPGVTMALRETEDAARKLNMQVRVADAQTSDEFDRAFAQLSAESVGGVVVLETPRSSNKAGGSRSLRALPRAR